MRNLIRPRLAAVWSAILLSAISASALGATGRTPGSFAVSPAGAATYSMPIWAPPGPNGLQPNISLNYNSQSRAGIVGVGWNLGGLSSIYRCNRTYAQDGVGAAVALSTVDGYCLDGKRLRLVNGSYGQAGSTYQTEVADFSNVTAYGTQGAGPAYFIVKDRNGRSYQYGNDNGSNHARVTVSAAPNTAITWLLNEVDDPAGNSMLVTYTTATGSAVPATISWTPTSHGSASYAYTMTFGYGTNVVQGAYSGYVAGTSVNIPYLLSSITIAHSGTTLKKYVLSYQVWSGTGRNDLSTVQECADDSATNCLRPTQMTYQPGSMGLADPSTLMTANGSTPPPNNFTAFDVNGDGRTDFVWQDSAGWWVSFGTSTGFSSPVSTGITTSSVAIGNVDGSVADGFLVQQGATWWYYKYNGSGFTGTNTNINIGLDKDAATTFALADVNGDGLPDLITTRSDNYLYVRLNTSTSGSASFNSTATQTIPNPYAALYSVWHTKKLDFYGSGQRDIVGWLNNSSGDGYYVLHFNGTTFVTTLLFPTNLGTYWLIDMGDFNDDGCTDLLTNYGVITSACNGAAGANIGMPAGVPGLSPVMSLDWDGDGRRDLLVSRQGYTTLFVTLSTGSAFSTNLIPTSLPKTIGAYIIHNPTGDGLDGIITEPLNPPYTYQYQLHNGGGQPPDLLLSITDGYGNQASPTYGSVAQGVNNYYFPSTASWPNAEYFGPLYVVKQATFSDPSGSGPTYGNAFYYGNGQTNIQGRGFAGFGNFQTHDLRDSGQWITRSYFLTFPQTGLFNGEIVTQDNTSNTTLRTTNVVAIGNELSSVLHQERYLPYENMTTTWQEYDSGIAGNRPVKTTQEVRTFDDYGNPIYVKTIVSDSDQFSPYVNQSWTSIVTTTFTPDTSANWCLTLPNQTTVSNTWSGSTRTRTASFNLPDYPHCRITEIVTEPGNSTYSVTKDLIYDAFGNISTLNVTGAGMAPRSWTTDWGSTGQFPVTLRDPVSNALGAAGYKSVKGYDYGFGVETSEVVQSADGSVNNAPATSWQYDPFGRRQRETRPDGTYTTWTYNDCAAWVGCPVGSHALALVQTVYNTDGSVQTDGTTWFDPVDRAVRSNGRMLSNGAYSFTGTQFDSLGRPHFTQLPCGYSGSLALCPYGLTVTYDAFGRASKLQRPVSTADTSLLTTNITYAGSTTTATDSYGKSATRITTPLGTVGVSQDHDNYRQTFSYDPFGNVLSVTDSLSNTLFTATYDYGIAAFQRNATDMDLDLSISTGQHRVYVYDALGEVTSWTDAKGQSFAVTYDGLARPLTRTEKLANGTVDLATNWTWGSTAASHNVGQLSVVTANGYTETYSYDATGRTQHQSFTIPADGTYTYDFAYNTTTGLLDTLTYPVSTPSYQLKLSYGYQNGILARVSDANAGTVYWAANATTPRGQVNQETLGNGIVTNRIFDAVTGLTSSLTSGPNGTATLQNESYLYDNAGNLQQRQNNNAGLTENFYYDDLYRLDHSTLNGTLNLQMGYNGAGNISSRSDVASGATWTYDAVHKHAVTQAGNGSYTYTYDNNGNATSRNGLGITWTSFNHPVKINGGSGESVEFAYNQDHERWSAVYTSPAGVETTYIIGKLLEKVVLPGGVAQYRHFIYAGGTKVAVYSRATSGNNLYYVREDHEGSVSALLNSDGTCYAKESFTAFGLRRSSCTWSGAPTSGSLTKINAVTRHGYTFQTALGNMGLNDLNGRIEDAVSGRFLSPDPNVQDSNDTQDFNRYTYTRNNPLTYVDPSGFEFICITTRSLGSIAGGEVIVNPAEQDCFPAPNFPWPYIPSPQPGGGGGGGTAGSTQVPCQPGVNCYVPQEDDSDEEVEVNGQCPKSYAFLAPVAVLPRVVTMTGLGVLAVVAGALGGSADKSERTQPQYVIRGGLASPENLIEGSTEVRGYNFTGFSVTTAKGMTVEELAMARRYPNRKISYTTVATLEGIGVPVQPTPNDDNLLHATAVVPIPLDPARAVQISALFTRIDNPAWCSGGKKK